jgi:hypothetical protein
MLAALPIIKTLLEEWGPQASIKIADLYTFTLVGGEILRYSGFQTEVTAPPPNATTPLNLFVIGPGFQRTKLKTQIGTSVDQLDIEIDAGPDDLIGGTPGTLSWQHAAWGGFFDGALVELDRAYLIPPYSTSPTGCDAGITAIGTVNRFTGRVGDVEIGRTRIKIQARSLLDLLAVQMPRRLYQSACNHLFGGKMCLFDRTTMSASISALAGSDKTTILTSLTPSPLMLYDNGTMTGTSGLNTGYSRSIGIIDAGVIHYLHPWIFPVDTGDEFDLLPGCDHTLNTCTTTFANQIHYGGFPDIPPPESAI